MPMQKCGFFSDRDFTEDERILAAKAGYELVQFMGCGPGDHHAVEYLRSDAGMSAIYTENPMAIALAKCPVLIFATIPTKANSGFLALHVVCREKYSESYTNIYT